MITRNCPLLFSKCSSSSTISRPSHSSRHSTWCSALRITSPMLQWWTLRSQALRVRPFSWHKGRALKRQRMTIKMRNTWTEPKWINQSSAQSSTNKSLPLKLPARKNPTISVVPSRRQLTSSTTSRASNCSTPQPSPRGAPRPPSLRWTLKIEALQATSSEIIRTTLILLRMTSRCRLTAFIGRAAASGPLSEPWVFQCPWRVPREPRGSSGFSP